MATKFYRSNNSDWNTDANWSSSSGGPADTTFPTGADDAKFDVNSGLCTLDAAAAALSLDFTGYIGTFDTSTFDLSVGIGALTFASGMTFIGGAGGSLVVTFGASGSVDFSILGTLTLNATHTTNLNSGVTAPTTHTINFGTHTYGNINLRAGADLGASNIETFEIEGSSAFTIQGDFNLNEQTASAITVTFTEGASPTINGSLKSVTGTIIVLNCGTGTWTVKTDIDFTNYQTFNFESAKFVFAGTGAQSITLAGKALGILEVTNTSPTSITFNGAADLDELIVDAATANILIKFESSTTHTIGKLTLSGSGVFRVQLRSLLPATTWSLTTDADQVVNHVDVQDSDASSSPTSITANTSTDSGNNISWDFDESSSSSSSSSSNSSSSSSSLSSSSSSTTSTSSSSSPSTSTSSTTSTSSESSSSMERTIQPQLQEPIPLKPTVLGGAVRIGSIVRFKGRERPVLDIRKKIVNVPNRLTSLPIKMTVIQVRIPEGFFPIGDVEVIKL